MQQTNWIITRNTHTGHFDVGTSKNPAPIISNFLPLDRIAAVHLEKDEEVWTTFRPHDGKICVIGFKRVKIVEVKTKNGHVLLRYQTFDHRPRHLEDHVVIRNDSSDPCVFTLIDEGRLEALAEGKAIYIGLHN